MDIKGMYLETSDRSSLQHGETSLIRIFMDLTFAFV